MLHCLVNVECIYHERQLDTCDASIFLMALYNPECVVPPELAPLAPKTNDPSKQAARNHAVALDDLPIVADSIHHTIEDTSKFQCRFFQLQPRIEQLIQRRWRHDVDVFELDNLIQAGFVRVWLGYLRNPEEFWSHGDGYWYAAAKRGARDEFLREFRQRYRQKGSGHAQPRQYIETVCNAGDLLASRYPDETDGDIDETTLSHEIMARDTEQYLEVDRRIEIAQLLAQIYRGTDPRDHPIISRIIAWMSEGLSFSEMASEEGVKTATIRCMVRRIRQACGALQSTKANKRNGYGSTKDKRILSLFRKGIKVPQIARLVGSDHKFVYRRLRSLNAIP